MSNPQPDPKKFSRLRRIEQITENHCGPAVIQMLLENIGVNVTQEEITEAAGATRTIETHGTRVDQLAKAVHELAPIAKLWYKENAGPDDLEYVLDTCKCPVGVEWQGLFDDMDDLRAATESNPKLTRATLSDVVAHIDHVVKIAGIDSVGRNHFVFVRIPDIRCRYVNRPAARIAMDDRTMQTVRMSH